MRTGMRTGLKLAGVVVGVATMSVVGFAQAKATTVAAASGPGVTVGYVDGMVMLDGHPLIPGQEATETLVPGKFLQTAEGRTEVELAPGMFLRLDEHSAVMLVVKSGGQLQGQGPDRQESGTRIEVEIERGRAEVAVDRIGKQDYLLIDQKDGGTQIQRAGLYEFDANKNTMRVFEGEAAVFAGTGGGSAGTPDEKAVRVKSGHQVAVTAMPGKAEEFDREAVLAQDGLFRWGNERAQEERAEGGGEPVGAPAGYPGYGDAYGWPGYYPAYYAGYYPGFYPYGFYGPAFYGGIGFYGGGFRGWRR